MELRQLRYFVAVAEDRHFRRAAARLHVAQPAISEQIKKLEAELGTPLFLRTSRSVELTDAGAAFFRDAKRMLRQLEQATSAVERLREGARYRLRIGHPPDGVPALVPQAFAALRDRLPGMALELRCAGTRELLADVRADHLDAAIVTLPAPLGALRAFAIGEQRAVALAPERIASARSAAGLELLSRHRLVLMARTANPAFHDAVTGAFHRAGLTPAFVAAAGTAAEHVALEVAAGAGIALLPEAVAERVSVPGVRAWPLIDEDAPRCALAVAVRDEEPGTPLTALLQALRAEARRAPAPAVPLLAAA